MVGRTGLALCSGTFCFLAGTAGALHVACWQCFLFLPLIPPTPTPTPTPIPPLVIRGSRYECCGNAPSWRRTLWTAWLRCWWSGVTAWFSVGCRCERGACLTASTLDMAGLGGCCARCTFFVLFIAAISETIGHCGGFWVGTMAPVYFFLRVYTLVAKYERYAVFGPFLKPARF